MGEKPREEVKLPNGQFPLVLQISQKVAKSMDNNNSRAFGGLQPSACLLRATTAISRPSEYWCMFDMPQKVAPVKVYLLTCNSGTMVCC